MKLLSIILLVFTCGCKNKKIEYYTSQRDVALDSASFYSHTPHWNRDSAEYYFSKCWYLLNQRIKENNKHTFLLDTMSYYNDPFGTYKPPSK